MASPQEIAGAAVIIITAIAAAFTAYGARQSERAKEITSSLALGAKEDAARSGAESKLALENAIANKVDTAMMMKEHKKCKKDRKKLLALIKDVAAIKKANGFHGA